MNEDEAEVIDFPLSAEDRERIAELQFELRVVELSSEVRELDASEFERIQKEHDEAMIRKALLERL